jgi:hypothetical protein
VAFLYNKISRKFLLCLIILWGVISFWQLNQNSITTIAILILGALAIVLTLLETAPIFLLIYLSFTTAYALYGFLFQYNLPVWLVMLGLLLIFGYVYLYVEQKIGILGNKRLIYLVLFCIINLEIFLSLSYYLINPLSKSLIIAIISYLFVGFSYTVLAKHSGKLATYVTIALIVVAMVLISSPWGGTV